VADAIQSSSANSLSVNYGCLNCNTQNATSELNKTIVGFVGNGTLSVRAEVMAGNLTIAERVIREQTPTGYTPEFNNQTISSRNATSYDAVWIARGNATNSVVNVSTIRNIVTNNSIGAPATSLPDRVAAPLINYEFRDVGTVNRTTTQVVYINEVMQGNKTIARYTPSNVTTYHSRDAAVASISNVPGGVQNKISFKESRLPIRNIDFIPKSNFTASAVAVRAYAGGTGNIEGRTLPSLPGMVANYLSVNSTIKDADINTVNYTFNVTSAWLVENKMSPLKVAMYRLNETTQNWVLLETTLVAANATNYIYAARSSGMSLYAISYTSLNITTANSAITILQQNLIANDTSAGQQTTPLQFNNFLMASVAALVIILMLLLYLYTKPPIGLAPQVETPTSKMDYGQ